MSRRGTTRAGHPALQPTGGYDPPTTSHTSGLTVEFAGEDGRLWTFQVGDLPLEGWHVVLADAWRSRVGEDGTLRTLASAIGAWNTVARFIRFLASLDRPPAGPSQLTGEHLAVFVAHRENTLASVWSVCQEISGIRALFRSPAMRDLAQPSVVDFLDRRRVHSITPRPGYSDGELHRLLAAARADVAALRDRIGRSERRLAALDDDQPDGQLDIAVLAGMAGSGVVPNPPGGATEVMIKRRLLAEQLFVTRRDVAALMVLLVAMTGCNVETVKELPAAHRLLEGRAVEIEISKRRRGPGRWHQTVTWEVGPPDRELHTPGGVYLLAHRLMSRSRALLDEPCPLWAVWRNMKRHGLKPGAEHHHPFGDRLNRSLYGPQWAARHRLVADAAPNADPVPLPVDFIRLRTSIEVRRTRQVGGHLPTAVRTNTIPVLFEHYLRGDPTTTEWAQAVVAEALTDVEQSAWAAHHRRLEDHGGVPVRILTAQPTTARLERLGLDHQTASKASAGELDTAWSTCVSGGTDPRRQEPCQLSFLDCFHCSNCLVTRDHLPRLLALLDELDRRRSGLSEQDWWARYGHTWFAVRGDVLTKFSPAELAAAGSRKPDDVHLDLVEPTWTHP
jgi:hypothetical protein